MDSVRKRDCRYDHDREPAICLDLICRVRCRRPTKTGPDGHSFAFTLFIFLETWITPVEGWLIDRIGPRMFLSIGGVLVGVGWTIMGYAHTLTRL